MNDEQLKRHCKYFLENKAYVIIAVNTLIVPFNCYITNNSNSVPINCDHKKNSARQRTFSVYDPYNSWIGCKKAPYSDVRLK